MSAGVAPVIPRPWGEGTRTWNAVTPWVAWRARPRLAIQAVADVSAEAVWENCSYLTGLWPPPPANGPYTTTDWSGAGRSPRVQMAVRAVVTPSRRPGGEFRLHAGCGRVLGQNAHVAQFGLAEVIGRGAVRVLFEPELQLVGIDSVHRTAMYRDRVEISAVEEHHRRWFASPVVRLGVVFAPRRRD